MAASHFDIVFCCETKAIRQRQAAELLIPGHCAPVFIYMGSRPIGLWMTMYSCSGLAVSLLYIPECDCCEFNFVRLYGDRLNLNVFFL